MKRRLTLITAVVVIFTLLNSSTPAFSSGLGEQVLFSADNLTATVPSKISYQGRLTDPGGKPLSGTFNMKFQVWNAKTGGIQYGSDIIRNGVVVKDGLFTVILAMPHHAFDGTSMWLQVFVSGSKLTPRQELLPAPYALSLRPGASITSPNIDTLHVGNQSNGYALEAWSRKNIAVVGTSGNLPFSPPSGLHGVHGVGEQVGVYGKSINGFGISGESDNGIAIYGESISKAGLWGQSNTGNGVRGMSMDLAGVWGESLSYHGIYGTTSASGPGEISGVYGFSTDGTGVTGKSNSYNGIKAMTSSNTHAALAAGNNGSGPAIYAETTDGLVSAIFKGNVQVRSLESGATVVELGEGLDYSEGFDVSDANEILPGTVLVIDADHPGELTTSRQAYDRKVAGIVAGANGLGSAVSVGVQYFDHPVALAGRVYCNVDASYGAVSPGDLLTTSPTPGYAMVVKNYELAQGAILGKAMGGLAPGEKGQILVLVTLQ